MPIHVLMEGGTDAVNGMTAAGVTSGLTTVMEVLGQCVTFIGGNPVLMVIFTGSLVGMGFKLFKKAKRSVK